MLDRRNVVRLILGSGDGRLVVSGLGSPTYDVAAAGDDARNFYLWGAMGGACMVGLGVALAQPNRRVMVVTGDGEMLMGLGSLATVSLAAIRPISRSSCSTTAFSVRPACSRVTPRDRRTSPRSRGRAQDLVVMGAAADDPGLAELITALDGADETLFARVQVAADEVPRVLPTRDGEELKTRFRAALGLAGQDYQ